LGPRVPTNPGPEPTVEPGSDNKELIEKMKLYLDTLKVNNEGNMKKKEYKENSQMLQKIFKINKNKHIG
jgi:hypothetical protein